MGLFDSIRRVVGGGQSTTDTETTEEDPELVDTHALDEADLRERAEGVAGEVSQLDFSLESLEQFDAAINAGYDESLATTDDPGVHAEDVVRFGCYLGEVLVRVYDGEWTKDPDWGVRLTGPDDTVTVAVFDVATRSIQTESVFAAVADRAAVEIGHDGDVGHLSGPDTDSPEVQSTEDDADETAVSDDDETDGDEPEAADDETDQTDAEGAGTDADEAPSTVDDEPSAAHETATEADDEPTFEFGRTDSDDEPASQSGDETDARRDNPLAASTTTEGDEATVADDTDSVPDTDDPSGVTDADDIGDVTDGDDPVETDASARSGSSVDDTDDVSALVEEAEPDAATPPEDRSLLDEADPVPEDDPVPEATSDPTEGDGIRAEYAEEAEGLVSFWNEHDLDYTPESLERLDGLVSEEWDDDRFADATFGSEETFDDRAFTSVSMELGSYFGEVLVRELGGEWSTETANDSVVIEGPDGPLAIPVFRVAGTSLTQQPVFARSYESLLADLDADA
jgi:hypothetical protein